MAKRTQGAEVSETTVKSAYEEMGYANHEEMEQKALLVRAIRDIMDARGLTQAQVAGVAGIDQPTLSKLLRGIFRSVSVDRLMGILRALGRDVNIVISGAVVGQGTDFARGHTGVVFVDGPFTFGSDKVQGPAELVGAVAGTTVGA